MNRRDAIGLGLLTSAFIADRVSKAVVQSLAKRTPAPTVGIHPTYNSGIAFSLPLPPSVSTGLIAAVVAVIAFTTVRRLRDRRPWLAWAMVAIGGFSNLLDRFRFGAVFDFIRLGPLPIFNFADLLVIVGLLLLLFRRNLTVKPELT